MANQNPLENVRCPKCFEEKRFIVQTTMNVMVEHDYGFDFSYGRLRADQFPGRVVPDNDGFDDTDPISCANRYGCDYTATFAEFRAHAKESARV